MCSSGFLGARAHARRLAPTQTRPRQAAVSARHQIGNKTLAARCPAPGPRPERRPECGGRLSTVLHPHFPGRIRGAGATYRWARPPGPPRVPGGSAARSPWGERETVDRRRALPRRRLCGERQAARLGRGGRGAEGPRGGGGESAQLPNQAPRGDPECRLERSRRGARSRWRRGRRCPVPEHQLLSGRTGPSSRRLQSSAPPIPPACPREI